MKKNFKIPNQNIKQLIPPMGGCFATDKITVEGEKVNVMIRDSPSYLNDSGWTFMAGTESQEYVDNPDNIMIYDVNTIANYDASIIPYLNYSEGTILEKRDTSDIFYKIEE